MAGWHWQRIRPGVAGVNLPAFVERHQQGCELWDDEDVSPGLTSRPSLSVLLGEIERLAGRVSPGLTSRPSLSGHRRQRERLGQPVSPGLTSRPSLSAYWYRLGSLADQRVAGVNLPAFVERTSIGGLAGASSRGVAGVNLPAFVERASRAAGASRRWRRVAGVNLPAFVERRTRFFASSPAAGVAGVNLPAFVERTLLLSQKAQTLSCRRG